MEIRQSLEASSMENDHLFSCNYDELIHQKEVNEFLISNGGTSDR
jgi:hypothetical protein